MTSLIDRKPGEVLGAPLRVSTSPGRKIAQYVIVAVLLVFAASFVVSIARNENFDFSVVLDNLWSPFVLQGLLVTFQLSVISMAGGLIIGVLVGLARLSSNVFLRSASWLYVWFFRGVPLLVQILLWGNFALLFRNLTIGIPFTDIVFWQVPTNSVLTTFVGGCIALAVHEGAYVAEIVRGGILSVPAGQREAAMALGMTSRVSMQRIILPQALRTMIPPLANQFILLIKASALVSVIAVSDLMGVAMDLAALSYRVIESLMVATVWYLVIVSVLSLGQWFLERRLARGYARTES